MARAVTRERRYHVGIRWRLFTSLAVFGILILLLLWVLQIRLLGFFYEREKFEDMNEIALELAAAIGERDFDERVMNCAMENATCIRVLDATSELTPPVVDAEATSHCVIHDLSYEMITVLYQKALENGGSYRERVEFDFGSERIDHGFHFPGIHPGVASINAVHAQIVEHEGTSYFILLDCELFPVNAVVRTLEVQFTWIILTFFVAIVLFAVLLSRMITKPLARITEKAKGLPRGEYVVEESDSGYREIQELSETLNYAAREIEATDRLQKELIANISHDLRTPLTMIKGYSEMMRDIPGENSPENIQAVIDETTRLSELVSDMLDLSKLQSGMQKPDFAVFDLTETVRDTMHRYDALIAHEGYRISFEDVGPAPVFADRVMILQVIYNLINNAVNYTGESRRVIVKEEILDGRVRLSVIDDGEGIPPDRISEIWERYYRVDRVHKRAVMGTGLGLSIVKGALDAHHTATYGVNSEQGVGSTFWFELPLASDEQL